MTTGTFCLYRLIARGMAEDAQSEYIVLWGGLLLYGMLNDTSISNEVCRFTACSLLGLCWLRAGLVAF